MLAPWIKFRWNVFSQKNCTEFSEVFVTDRKLALTGFMEKVFLPESKHVLCSWHIYQNDLSKHKKIFILLPSSAPPQK